MENKSSIEKLGIINDINLTVLPRLSSRQLNANQRRKILLILLSILFIIHLIYLIFHVHAYIDYLWFNYYFKNHYEFLWILIAVIYDSFGLLVTYQYSRKGLYLFIWIGIIFLISIFIVFGIIFLNIFYTTNIIYVNILGSLIFIFIFIISAMLLIIIVLLSFQLSKLIYHTNDRINQSI